MAIASGLETIPFSSIYFLTDRYDPDNNYMYLEPTNRDASFNKRLAECELNRFNPKVVYTRMDRNLTNRIIIPLKDTLPLIKYLFEKNVISAEQHLGLRDKLVELKACANYQAKLTDSMISMDQFNLLNQLALPHLSVLKKHMDNSTIKEALSHAHPYAMGLLDLEKSFKVIMCKERVMKAFSPEEQSTLCPSLLALGKILGGKALIEDSLLLSTDSLPDLKVQKNIIFSHLL